MYGNLVDMNYIHSENSDIIDYLKYVEKNSTLKYLTININNKKRILLCEIAKFLFLF